MAIQKELESIKKKVLTVLNSENVKRHNIRIKTATDTDIIFWEYSVRLRRESFFIDITDSSFAIHIMIPYEDITEISDRTTSKVLYEKVN